MRKLTAAQIKELRKYSLKEVKEGKEMHAIEQMMEKYLYNRDLILEDWNEIFRDYPNLLESDPKVFKDAELAGNTLNKIIPQASLFLIKASKFKNKYTDYCSDISSYLNDQKEVLTEISNFNNVDKNIFTLKANQTMRVPEFMIRLNALLKEFWEVEKEMNTIEKSVASISIFAN